MREAGDQIAPPGARPGRRGRALFGRHQAVFEFSEPGREFSRLQALRVQPRRELPIVIRAGRGRAAVGRAQAGKLRPQSLGLDLQFAGPRAGRFFGHEIPAVNPAARAVRGPHLGQFAAPRQHGERRAAGHEAGDRAVDIGLKVQPDVERIGDKQGLGPRRAGAGQQQRDPRELY